MRRRGVWADARAFVLVLAFALPWLAGGARAESHLDAIVARGEIRIGLINQPPFVKYDPATQSWAGPNHDMAKLFAEAAGLKVSFVELNYSNVIAGIQAGKVDAVLSPFYATPKRTLAVWYTIPYRYERSGILMRKERAGKFNDLADLNKEGVNLVVTTGSASERDAVTYFPKATTKVANFDSVLLEVQGGRVDAWLTDMDTAALAASKNTDWAVVWHPEITFNPTPMSFLVPRGDAELAFMLNTAIQYYETQGTILEIENKWGMPDWRKGKKAE